MDPETGAIKAIYGGEDATKHFTNNADDEYQVGSTLRASCSAAAMKSISGTGPAGGPRQDERTKVNPQSLFSGQNDLKIKNYDGSIWKNEDGKEWLQENDGKRVVQALPGLQDQPP
ncbi:peptidoglycan glycosyltransferase OS=Streptomyces alboniger OX=132473 GN=CP975_17590 PE=4 SV=1 [Streptomyces alboniger]